jgi:hypothetical protein
MARKKQKTEQQEAIPEKDTGLEEIRQVIRKQELQMAVLKKIIEKTKTTR